MTAPTLAFLGIGLMGSRMAPHLLSAGFPVRVWNRSRAKAEPLVLKGASIHNTPAEAVAGADVIISILSDGPATAAIQSDPEVRNSLGEGATWVEMGSIKPDEARHQATDLETLGLKHLDAPVSGGTKGAEAASLAIMVGGPSETFNELQPILPHMGRPVHVGPSGAGQLAKLANQAIVAVTISAVAEATLLLERGGADPSAVRDALKGGFADSVILQQHGARMSDRNFVPGGLTKIQLKDLDNVLSEASSAGLALPTTQLTRDRFAHITHEMGGGDWDHSAMFLELLARNGLPLPDPSA